MGMTCIIVTLEIAFAREVGDQIYLVIEHALSVVMTSSTDCSVLSSYLSDCSAPILPFRPRMRFRNR